MSKASFLTLIFLSVCLGLKAQTGESSDFKRIQIGLSFSPDVNYRTLVAEDNAQWIKELRDEDELPMFGFTTGLNVAYNFTRMFGIETGIQYSLKGFEEKWEDGFNPIQIIDPNIPARMKAINSFHYLDIPIKGNITVGKGKLRFIGSIGLVVNVYLASSWTGISESQSGERSRSVTKEPYDYQAVNISPMVSAGIDWKLNDRMSLQAKPTFRYGVLSIIDAPIKGFLWSGGIDLAWYFGL